MYSRYIYVLELLKLFLLQRLMGYSPSKKMILPFCATAVASVAAIWFLRGILDPNVWELMNTCLTVAAIALLMKGRHKVVSAALGITVLWFADVFFESTLVMLISETVKPYAVFTSLLLLVVLTATLYILKKPPLFRFQTFSKRQVLLFMAGLLSFALYLAPYQIASFEIDSPRANQFLAVLSAISGIFLIFISINAGQKHHYRETAKMTETMRKNQEKYFQLLLSKEEETKKFRHDFNNHLYSIKYLLESGKMEELQKYVDDMHLISSGLKPEVQTGSDVVNAILCELRESYKDVGYTIDWKGFFPEGVKLAPIDLSSIFYNLLANAIEAVYKLPQDEDKTIKVRVKHSGGLLYFSVKNSCAGMAQQAGTGFATSKREKSLHGFGSQNVAMSVEKYGGEIKYNQSETTFEAEVFFGDMR